MEEGSFDGAIMGCVGVFHTASPVAGVSGDPKGKVLDPAINGTLNVLRSCKKNPSLKRVVITSSSAAVRNRRDGIEPNIPLDESSWCNVDVDFCQRFKVWYSLSKTLAERAAWEFAKENNIDLVTVLPSFLVGPSLPTDLSSTASDILALLRGESEKFSWYGRMGFVDIDDVARCHILVFEDPSAEGRYLCSSKVLDNHELASFLAKRYPYLPIPKRFENPWGNALYYEFNTSKLCNLGFKFKGMEEMFDDCIASLKEQGHIPY
ncbi:hypothetical protein MRB53_005429 [Persea americana]|uniref:Uncharacterized protein n=1 Tax=Persea americana TaxID=3435 RepID=A0ACC2MDF3_PERAE|nr:hypothetical protein MRB53_005429 [Persea americana]